jgi:serine phosphatase RsbU (regulator of sigma subunit)/anti-sigma regulatory factor (Ser/Thr protein kinase)
MMTVARIAPTAYRRIHDAFLADAELAMVASRLFGGCAAQSPYAERARRLVDAVVTAFGGDEAAVEPSGMAIGLETAGWTRDRGDRVAQSTGPGLTRVETLLSDLPDRLPAGLRQAARERIALFITGYLAGLFSGAAAWDYEFTAIVVRRLGTARSSSEMAQIAVETGMRGLQADAAWVAERGDLHWPFLAQRGLRLEPESQGISDATLSPLEALAGGEPIAYDTFDDAPPGVQRLARGQGLETALLVPLMIEGQCAAIIGFGRRNAQPFLPRERAFAGILSAQISARLRELRAQAQSRDALNALRASEKQTIAQLRRKERAVDVLQHAYIPRALPVNPHLRFDALYVPADDEARVGGDWYDVFALDDGRLVFSVGDVAGHGVDAAVTMGIVRQAILIAATGAADPSEILVTVNRSLLVQRLTVTAAIVGIYDPQMREIRYACAGHPPPIFVDATGARTLPFGGIPLGVEPVASYAIETVQLDLDTALILYTDGLIEHDRDVVTGTKRLIDTVRRLQSPADEPHNWATLIADAVLAGAADDDLAILTIRALPSADTSGISAVQTHRDTIAWDFQSADLRSIAATRRHFIRFLTPFVLDDENVLMAEIILGELLSNVVEHAPGPVHLELAWDGITPTVTVRDRGPGGVKRPALPADDYAEHGRGVFLVSTLAQRVDIQRGVDGGTTVTAWLPLTRNDRATR